MSSPRQGSPERGTKAAGKDKGNVSGTDESALIRRLAERLRISSVPAGVRLGIGDDAALLEAPPGHDIVLTTDALVEGVHFRRDWCTPEDLGWKSLAVNVSDLGAMGAAPLACAVSLALPLDLDIEWVQRLYDGLGSCSEEYACPCVGGDTVRSPGGVFINLTAVGTVPAGRAVTRAGARAGDLLCVTGTLGDSAAGFALLEAGRTASGDPGFQPLFEAHCRPRPPVLAARALAAGGGATSMMDLSDGLASDLARLCEQSRSGALVERDRLPVSVLARRAAESLGRDVFEWAISGGEDYEYLFTLPPGGLDGAAAALGKFGVTATRIGVIREHGVGITGPDGREEPLVSSGYSHFRSEKETSTTGQER